MQVLTQRIDSNICDKIVKVSNYNLELYSPPSYSSLVLISYSGDKEKLLIL